MKTTKIKLIARSRKGQNKINQHGEIWELLEDRGHEIVVRSLNNTWGKGEKDIRRILVDDPDFMWEKDD